MDKIDVGFNLLQGIAELSKLVFCIIPVVTAECSSSFKYMDLKNQLLLVQIDVIL